MARTTSMARTTRLARMAGMGRMSTDFLSRQVILHFFFANQSIAFFLDFAYRHQRMSCTRRGSVWFWRLGSWSFRFLLHCTPTNIHGHPHTLIQTHTPTHALPTHTHAHPRTPTHTHPQPHSHTDAPTRRHADTHSRNHTAVEHESMHMRKQTRSAYAGVWLVCWQSIVSISSNQDEDKLRKMKTEHFTVRTTDAHFSRARDTSSTHMRWLKFKDELSIRVCVFSKSSCRHMFHRNLLSVP